MAGAATVEKALDVLFHLHDAGTAVGLSDIGRALDLPKSSCHRLLSSLVDREVVDRDDHGRYRPGLALLSLGLGAQRREPVVSAARPTLEREADALGETVFLVGRRHGRLRVLDKVEGSGFLRAAPGVGDVVPPDVTAAGQLYAVFDRQDQAEDQAEDDGQDGRGDARPPAASAASARVDAETERRIRRDGHALNRDAWIDGLSVLGVPIWQDGGQGTRALVAVLALAASSPRFSALGEARIAERLLVAADVVGARLSAGGRLRRAADRRGGTA